jgi:hypothetical protein
MRSPQAWLSTAGFATRAVNMSRTCAVAVPSGAVVKRYAGALGCLDDDRGCPFSCNTESASADWASAVRGGRHDWAVG